jgi:hypothetical protein
VRDGGSADSARLRSYYLIDRGGDAESLLRAQGVLSPTHGSSGERHSGLSPAELARNLSRVDTLTVKSLHIGIVDAGGVPPVVTFLFGAGNALDLPFEPVRLNHRRCLMIEVIAPWHRFEAMT